MLKSKRSLALLALLSGAVLAQPPKAMVVLNAASGAPVVAPDSIASAFGLKIGASTDIALTLPLQTVLNGVSLQMADSAQASSLGLLFYVSPNQINFEIPPSVAVGAATVTVIGGKSSNSTADVTVATVAPGLFTANGAGTGVAAALAIHRSIAIQTDTLVPVFTCSDNGCTSVGIDTSGDSDVTFLELFGTGIRGRSSLANVSVTIGGQSATVLFAGAQGQFPGLDQVNVQLPQDSTMHGEQGLILTVDGQVANKVRVNLK